MHHYLRLFVIAFFMLLLVPSQGQQTKLFSHYYWNEQHYNPAYVGSKDLLHVQVLDRIQWVGIDGAPNTFSAAVHTPLPKDNIALGINFYNDRIGALSSNGVSVQYAYRIKFKEGRYKLSLGAQAGAEFRNLNTVKLHTEDGFPDMIDPLDFEKSWNPIIGAGVYFYGEQFSVGLGIPQLLPASAFKSEKWGFKPSMEVNLSAAYQFNISNDFRLLPTTTVKVLKNQKSQAEFNLNAILYDRFMAGLGVRTEKSLIFMGQYMHEFGQNKKLSIGYAYDLSWKALRPHNSGSHEVFVSFGMPLPKAAFVDYKSPRYF